MPMCRDLGNTGDGRRSQRECGLRHLFGLSIRRGITLRVETTDGGATWASIVGTLPEAPVNDIVWRVRCSTWARTWVSFFRPIAERNGAPQGRRCPTSQSPTSSIGPRPTRSMLNVRPRDFHADTALTRARVAAPFSFFFFFFFFFFKKKLTSQSRASSSLGYRSKALRRKSRRSGQCPRELMDCCIETVKGAQSRGDRGDRRARMPRLIERPSTATYPSVIDEDVGMPPRCGTARMRCAIFLSGPSGWPSSERHSTAFSPSVSLFVKVMELIAIRLRKVK